MRCPCLFNPATLVGVLIVRNSDKPQITLKAAGVAEAARWHRLPAREQPHALVLALDDEPIAVMLYLVNPVGAGRNLNRPGRQAGLERTLTHADADSRRSRECQLKGTLVQATDSCWAGAINLNLLKSASL